MKVLVTAASRHGATEGIAEAIGRALTAKGLDVTVMPLEEVTSMEPYYAVVLGSGLYIGHWLDSARDFVESNHEALSQRAVWLFSSGPVGEPGKPVMANPLELGGLREETNARDHRVFSGRIDKHLLGVGEKLVTGALRVPEGDFREWDDIQTWADEIAADLMEDAAPKAQLT